MMVFIGTISIKGYVMVFMKIVSTKRRYAMVFLCRFLLLKLIISMKRGYVYVWGMGKKCVSFAGMLFEV